MPETRVHSTLPAVVIALIFVVPLPAVALFDDFDDNDPNPILWDLTTVQKGLLTETNQHVEYTSALGATDENEAAFRLKIAQPFDSPWTLTLDVHVGDYGVPNPLTYEYGVEFSVENNANAGDSLGFARFRGDDGAGTGFEDNHWRVYKQANGSTVFEDGFEATGSDGTLTLAWDGSTFSLTRAEGVDVQLLKTVTIGDW
jgi:hypothetical protein